MLNKKVKDFFDFTNQTIIVTGGSMGIGYAVAKRFAEAGANLVIADINDIGKIKAQIINQEYSVKARFIKTDISIEDDVKKLINETEKQFGKINVLVNSAGIFPMSPVLEMDLDFWEKTQSINLRGVFLCCREAAQSMIKSSQGNIINIASVASLGPTKIGLAAYDASKHGMWGFTKNFALEMIENKIRVNAIAPGGIKTEGVEITKKDIAWTPENHKDFSSDSSFYYSSIKNRGEPDGIATIALFLASDAASYITGSIIVADGGKFLI